VNSAGWLVYYDYYKRSVMLICYGKLGEQLNSTCRFKVCSRVGGASAITVHTLCGAGKLDRAIRKDPYLRPAQVSMRALSAAATAIAFWCGIFSNLCRDKIV
jgi:hypothetical protein